MQTQFVNPRRRTRNKRKSTKSKRRASRRNVTMANPRRRKRSYARRRPATRRRNPRRPATRRRRRRNAGVTSFTRQNPLILSNPPRRRARRRNPKLNLKTVINKTLTFSGGAALGYAANQFGLSNIQNDWMRRAAQVATAVGGSMFLKGELGAAFAGATMYPLIADVAMYTGLVAMPTDADLDELAADIEQAMLEEGGGYDELQIEGIGQGEEVIW